MTVDLLQRTGTVASPVPALPDNPFFDIVLRKEALAAVGLSPGNQTQLDQLALNASVGVSTLLLWIGNNDILASATDGTDAGMNPATGSATSFDALFGAVAARVAAMNVPQVAVANIPSITSAAFFTAIPTFTLIDIGNGPQPFNWSTDEDDVQLILLPAQALCSDRTTSRRWTEPRACLAI